MWAVSPEIGASHRVPQKNKWVSCLSVVRYWVSSLECCQCAKVAGGGAECSLVFLTWWDRLEGKGGWEDPLQATLTNTPKKQHCLLSNVLDEHTTLTRHKHVHLSTCLEPALYCPIAAFCCFPVILKGRAQILYSVTSVIYFQSRQEQSWRNHGDEWMTFLFIIRDKWAVDRRERENNRERSLLWYSDYVRPFWQTNVLVPNSEWLSEWPEGVSSECKILLLCLCMKTKLENFFYILALPHSPGLCATVNIPSSVHFNTCATANEWTSALG